MDGRTSALALLIVVACSCEKNPASIAGPTPLPKGPILQVMAGALDDAVVETGTVTVAGGTYSIGQRGLLVGAPASLAIGEPVEVEAPGFLPRRTRVPSNGIIRMWPIAGDAEREAVRKMVYQWAGPVELFDPPQRTSPFTLTLLGATAEQKNAWIKEAATFGAEIGVVYIVADFFQYDADELAVEFVGGQCTPDPLLRFCRDGRNYKAFRISPDAALDPLTIRRVLASWFIGPNPFPGLVSPTSPEPSLSPFERQTIGMMLVRDKRNRWPDDDQDSPGRP
jgi:hypothetical protein